MEDDSGSDVDCAMLDSSVDSEVVSCSVECTGACCDLEATVAAGNQNSSMYLIILKRNKGVRSASSVLIGTEDILGWYFVPLVLKLFVTSADTVLLKVASRINADEAFVLNGYNNWKKAHERFRRHASSSCHRESVIKFDQMRFPGVDTQLSKQLKSRQLQHRRMLMIQLHSLRFLLRQGLAVRGHNQEEGNFFS